MSSQINQLTSFIKDQGNIMSGKMIALLQAAKVGQKAVNQVARAARQEQEEMMGKMPEELRVPIPNQFYSVVRTTDGKTKLQVTLPVEETLDALQKTIESINKLIETDKKSPTEGECMNDNSKEKETSLPEKHPEDISSEVYTEEEAPEVPDPAELPPE